VLQKEDYSMADTFLEVNNTILEQHEYKHLDFKQNRLNLAKQSHEHLKKSTSMVSKKTFYIFLTAMIGCLCFFATLPTVHAQSTLPQPVTDSLFAVWNDPAQPDTNRLKAIQKLALDGYLYSQPDSAYYYAQQQYDFANDRKLRRELASALHTQGTSWQVRRDYEKAIDYYNQSSKISEEIGDRKGIANCLNSIGKVYRKQGNYTTAVDYCNQSLKIQEEIGNKHGMAAALDNMGFVYWTKGDMTKALDYFSQSLKVYEELENQEGIATSLNRVGAIYHMRSDYATAISYYIRSLKILEKLENKLRIASLLHNIGLLYRLQDDYDNAIEYFTKALKIFEEQKDKEHIADSYNSIGLTYTEQGDVASEIGNAELSTDKYTKALDFLNKSLKICIEIDDKHGVSTALANLGLVYINKSDSASKADNHAKAMDYFNQSLKIQEEIKDNRGVAVSLGNIGFLYLNQGDFAKAIEYSSRSLVIAQEIEAHDLIKNAAKHLWGSYKETGRFKASLEMYELHVATGDSIESEANRKEVIRQGYKFDYEKKAAQDSVVNAEAKKIADAKLLAEQAEKKRLKSESNRQRLENQNQQQQAYFLYGGLALALLFGAFIFNRFRVTQKQKGVIESQKTEVEQQKEKVDHAYEQLEEKNTEILDSINYAKRIQSAILPPDKLVKEYLQNSFILYKPKDIVAGDFYWMEPTKNGILFAAADCTGHGVPGAMVSVVCNNALNRSVREYGLTDPGKILDKTREIVIQEFEKSEDEVKDGMDIALCSLEGTQLKYAGAHNPLWIVRGGEVIETKANKQPIGQFDQPIPYVTHHIELQKSDSVYIFSDGYVDQFGGERGKKFKPKALRELLLSVQDQPMDRQRQLINEAFEHWQGDLEQVDDVCVIGVKI
jgi:serine phosphatase RsbU (regulator of sigma subunit)